MKIPQWIKNAREEDNDWLADDDRPPPVATLPEYNAHDEELNIMQRAAMLHGQLKRSVETAQVELAEAVLARQGDQQKIEFLEKEGAELRLEIAQLQNTIATLQSEVMEKSRFMELVRQVLDKYGIKAPPKKERKAKPAKQKSTA